MTREIVLAKKKGQEKGAARSTDDTYTIHLVAAATGELLSGLVSVAMTQFPKTEFDVVSHPLQNSIEKLEATLDNLSGDHPIVLHALADESAKLLVRNKCVVRRISQFDATGPLVNFISACVGVLPVNDVSRLHQLNSAYQSRIEAMEFALKHDDSLGLSSLQEADIVIIGVSRVSKSPTTLYLASRGCKAANVSISPETGFPEELEEISQDKIVALTIQPKLLHEIRSDRAKRLRTEGSDYENLKSVIREVMAAEAEYRRRGYPIIDVTTLTIEQTIARFPDNLLRHLEAIWVGRRATRDKGDDESR
jgi:regulator of PEP synthase PpsR (kinase-PPPase family)